MSRSYNRSSESPGNILHSGTRKSYDPIKRPQSFFMLQGLVFLILSNSGQYVDQYCRSQIHLPRRDPSSILRGRTTCVTDLKAIFQSLK